MKKQEKSQNADFKMLETNLAFTFKTTGGKIYLYNSLETFTLFYILAKLK